MTDRRLLARRFETVRPQLLAVATRLLGSVAEAEDAVQESWLRLERADTATIANLDAWLTTVVSRICLDQLRAPRRSRERSWQVEPWRDEPVAEVGDPVVEAERSDAVSAALLVVLDELGPAERLAFVLHDVFGTPFGQVADVLGRSPQAARQLASRARRRVRGASSPGDGGASRGRQVVEAWLAAVQGGDLGGLLELLDEGAVLRADYGDRLRVVEGAARIADQARTAARLAAHSVPVLLDGRPGVAAVLEGRLVSLMAFDIDDDGRIVGLDVLADPDRLREVDVDRLLVD
ncbi:sigma-70 family RNA polymerase sigma factor [Actinotalea caeni]|uniref:sigma-70 family RNA polymerase sigma factor n=1 Tax=Actinotalea caeni TaxID=1348467 RepID=UPI0012E2E690|nr:sigma-70 family RNA polymerase sigma factor [Actinotalea caeni]